MPKFDVVVSLTSPPLISYLGSLFVKLKGGKLLFWVMDLNPDEAIAAGWLKQNSLAAEVLSGLLNYSLANAEKIIVLDRFMKRRIMDKGIPDHKLVTIAPWSHSDEVRYDAEARLSFRTAHGLSEKFVVMYSGNHSPCHPLDTLLEGARRLADTSEIVFCFVGGGSEQSKVRQYSQKHGLTNVLCLPYQPLDKLAGSLSAADLQVVVMGEGFAGIVHPCKVYNILEVGAPFLYIGPPDSHIVDLISGIEDTTAICSVRHGEVDLATQYLLERSKTTSGSRSVLRLTSSFSKEALLPQVLKLMESVSEGKPEEALAKANKQPVAH
jgi:glycosyltransferase involved in cell wall biosynthesis